MASSVESGIACNPPPLLARPRVSSHLAPSLADENRFSINRFRYLFALLDCLHLFARLFPSLLSPVLFTVGNPLLAFFDELSWPSLVFIFGVIPVTRSAPTSFYGYARGTSARSALPLPLPPPPRVFLSLPAKVFRQSWASILKHNFPTFCLQELRACVAPTLCSQCPALFLYPTHSLCQFPC